jgi:hypothetical protein
MTEYTRKTEGGRRQKLSINFARWQLVGTLQKIALTIVGCDFAVMRYRNNIIQAFLIILSWSLIVCCEAC